MKEQAGFEPGPGAFVPDAGAAPFDAVAMVVPPTRRLAMPVQRLDALSLRRLFGASGRLAPAALAGPGGSPQAPAGSFAVPPRDR